MVGATSPVKENNNYRTPPEIFWYFNEYMHYQFEVDLAADKDNTKCPTFYSENQNALEMDWYKHSGWLWCNPPYGRNLPTWIQKAYIEMYKGAKICMLIPASVGTKYWHCNIINVVDKIMLFDSRIKWIKENGEIVKDSPKYDSALIEFTPKEKSSDYTKFIGISLAEIYNEYRINHMFGV